MKIYLTILVFFILYISIHAQVNPCITITDDLGNEIEFLNTPNRVITLAPNLTEMIYELGVERYLMGNTLYCNYPPAADSILKVGDMLTYDYEKIISMDPDLIFITVEGNTKAAYEKFIEFGLKVFVSNPRNYDGIKKTFLDFGKIFNRTEIALGKIVEWDSTVSAINKLSQHNASKTVMFLIEINPIMLAGKNTFLNEFIRICGLVNLAENSPINYPVYSREQILIKNPDYIVYPTNGAHTVSSITDIYPEWNYLNAIKYGHVIFLNWDLFSRPGPRFVEALKLLSNRLHQ